MQDLTYTYDPAGNTTHIQDDADIKNVVYFNNQRIDPSASYRYDASYRLIAADGREHIGQAVQPESSWDDQGRVNLAHPHDGQAMRQYVERYLYDEVGNIDQVVHALGTLTAPGQSIWRRTYVYAGDSLIEDGRQGNTLRQSNRLGQTMVGRLIPGQVVPEAYTHDRHGNITSMAHLQNMEWDFKDRLQHIQQGSTQTYYVYDDAGQRVRKVVEKNNGALIEERIYLGMFEIFRSQNGVGGTVTLERETLHIIDDKQRVALVETKTVDVNVPANTLPSMTTRYQFGNRLGSASLELDDQAQIMSYEEYTPYGSSTYQAVRSQTETAKRYRYTGKERDEESGFYYHGARYFAPWLGRWMSCEPAALIDGPNSYAYVRGNPIRMNDPSGMAGETDFSELHQVDNLAPLKDTRTPLAPASTPMSGPEARAYGNKQAADFRSASGMNQGASVQAGHTAAARHAPESGISKADWDKQQMQELHSRKGQGLDVTVKDQSGKQSVKTCHTAQEGLIDDAVERARKANAGKKLTPQGQLDAAAEVKWRTENIPMDQRDVNALRNSGSVSDDAAKFVKAEKTTGSEVLKEGGNVLKQTVSAEKTGLKEGAKLLGTKAAKFVPFVGIGVGVGLVANDLRTGDYASAAWDAAEAIPVIGDVVGAAHLGITVGTAANEGLGIDKVAAEHGTMLEGAAKSLGFSADTSRLIGATGPALSSITVAPQIAIQNKIAGWFR